MDIWTKRRLQLETSRPYCALCNNTARNVLQPVTCPRTNTLRNVLQKGKDDRFFIEAHACPRKKNYSRMELIRPVVCTEMARDMEAGMVMDETSGIKDEHYVRATIVFCMAGNKW